MKPRWSLQSADREFLEWAPLRIVHILDIDLSSDALWRSLTADDALVPWAPGITRADWTSTRPLGVGSRRIVEAAGGVAALSERFFRWEEGARFSFYVEAASLPGFRKFAEDVVLEPILGGCRLTWTFAVEAQPWLAPVLTRSRPILERVTRGWALGLAHHTRLAEGAST